MTHDFAKIRPEPLLEKKPVEAPPAWSLMITGMVVGLAIGVFACVLFYMSGNVPPLTPNGSSNVAMPSAVNDDNAIAEEIPAEGELELEFYHELKNYEVTVDATPVPLTSEQAAEQAGRIATPLETNYMLQTGAFQQQDLATQEMQRQRVLGLEVIVKAEELLGRTLYLVQSGPYVTNSQLLEAERLLSANNIPSMRMSIQ